MLFFYYNHRLCRYYFIMCLLGCVYPWSKWTRKNNGHITATKFSRTQYCIWKYWICFLFCVINPLICLFFYISWKTTIKKTKQKERKRQNALIILIKIYYKPCVQICFKRVEGTEKTYKEQVFFLKFTVRAIIFRRKFLIGIYYLLKVIYLTI